MAGLANYQNFMTELMVGQQIVFGFEHVLVTELSGGQRAGNAPDYIYTRDPNQQRVQPEHVTTEEFHGKKITVPLQLNDVSSQAIGEKATFPVTAPFDTLQATYNLISRLTSIAVTKELEDDAKDGSTSAMESVAAYTQSAYRAHARTDNDFCHSSAVATAPTNGLLANVTGAATGGGLTLPVAGANMDQMTPGRVISVLTRATGANPGNGLRRKILSVIRTPGSESITVDTNAYASDGQSGAVTAGATEGIYLDTSVAGTQVAPFGLGSGVATAGVVGGIDKATNAQWQGTNVDAGAAVLSDDSLDSLTYLLRGVGVGAPDFAIAHPLTVDPYKATKTSLVRMDMQTVTVRSGFKGIIYQGADQEFPILKDLSAPRKVCRTVVKSVIKLYGRGPAPSFIDDDGSMFRFYSRNTEKEADLFDRWQMVFRDCAKLGQITNLSE